ncbi:MAG TPA: hypothetical protein VMR25_03875 [Planctomycetaceae bacterium]|jgi:hypothetical protein|nr:hypothetical protein [Planctomycetaceae bacterium]
MDQAMLQTLATQVVALRVFRCGALAIVDKEKLHPARRQGRGAAARHELEKRISSQEYDPQQTR